MWMVRRLFDLIRYNRDWPRYLRGRFTRPGRDSLSTFRLRNGQTVAVRSEGRFILNEIYLDRVYEVPGVDLTRCRSVLDVGGNVGLFALYVASRAPQAHIHCFEPDPKNFEILERNLALNKVHAKAYRVAVSTTCGVGHLTAQGNSFERSLGNAGASTIAVDCIDWDHIFSLTAVDRFDFVKIDIEGHEREILAACSDSQLRRIGALSLEWHHGVDELETLAHRLRGIGFDAKLEIQAGNTRYLKARARVV
jgi:FkbM family methyltransferase